MLHVYICTFILSFHTRHSGHAVEQLIEAQHYKQEGCGFDWNLSLTSSFRPHFDPGVDSASNNNEYQEYLKRG